MAYPYQTQSFTLDNSGRRIVVDPVTRIEGHMRCEVNIDSKAPLWVKLSVNAR